MLTPVEFINQKKFGKAHAPEDIRNFMQAYMEGKVQEYQMAAWLMAARLKGLERPEILALTKATLESGVKRPKTDFGCPVVDKHSTGGVGDKPTIVLLPLMATMGVIVPTLTGRGLGHTGGTVDKLESLPGLRQEFSWEEAAPLLKINHAAFMTQTAAVAPLDRRLYALRDVTGTVDSLGLICASILGKKLSENLDGLVLDVKYGSGGFMQKFEDARELGATMKEVAMDYGVRTKVLLTDMGEPLGEWAGNCVEVREALEMLRGHHVEERFYNVTLSLAVAMCQAAFPNESKDFRPLLEEKLKSGEALRRFNAIAMAQGVPEERLSKLDEILSPAPCRTVLKASSAGFISKIDVVGLGQLLISLGGGRKYLTDKVDAKPALHFLKHRGEAVEKGEPIMEAFSLQPLEAPIPSGLYSISKEKPEIQTYINEL